MSNSDKTKCHKTVSNIHEKEKQKPLKTYNNLKNSWMCPVLKLHGQLVFTHKGSKFYVKLSHLYVTFIF